MEDICIDGITYRPLHTGVLRERGDVYFFDGKLFPELEAIIGQPQKADPEPIEQSYRPVTK